MKVCVFGLWHLGCVTAACLARGGHDVVGIDPDPTLIERLRKGELPLYEPGLAELVASSLANGSLRFEVNSAKAVADAEVLWVTFDTPVSEEDVPQIEAVVDPVVALIPALPEHCLVLVSSQVPVGTTRRLSVVAANVGRQSVTFGYSPENLRLGKAIDVFSRPDRVVVGLQSDLDRNKVSALLEPFTTKVIWMGIESAEMTKHAINAFLATSVVFMNELATLCEQVGAQAKEVENGLKSEARIGPGAYLSPGGPFAGGTLARDVNTLSAIGSEFGVPVTLVKAVRESNNKHRSWAFRKLKQRFASLSGKRIAILGLTYKPGTSTLRRSDAVELAKALHADGAIVVSFDPAVDNLPPELTESIILAPSASKAVEGADAVVISTPCPEFKTLDWSALLGSMTAQVVVDSGWFLAPLLMQRPDIAYAAVGLPWRQPV